MQVIGDKELAAALNEAPGILQKALGKGTFKAANELRTQTLHAITTKKGVYTGQMFNNINVFGPYCSDGEIYSKVGTNVKHARAYEYGSRPHHVPIEALKTWARTKLHNEKAAIFVQRNIQKHGTKPRYVFKESLEQKVAPKMQDFIQEAMAEAFAKLQT